MKIFPKAILPAGFQANAVASGIKRSGKLDLALFYSELPAKAAAVFTTNEIQAAPLVLSRKKLARNKFFRALLVNSGNANCFTGKQGLSDAQETGKSLARVLHLQEAGILLASTGIIGKRLPKEKIKKAIPGLAKGLSSRGMQEAAAAILTTDTFAKAVTLQCQLGKKKAVISAVAKGAGMIAPNLATMLVFIFTDANISQKALVAALKSAVDQSFNCITIDGCMSTNDMVVVLANGAAKNKPVSAGNDFAVFAKALDLACLHLAKLIVRDAEGATKFIQIKVSGAKNPQQAKRAALSVANSNLFKAATYGENPNFGRIVAAIGSSGVAVKEEDLKIRVSPLEERDVFVEVSLGRGKASAVIYTSDLTPEYIRINAEYN